MYNTELVMRLITSKRRALENRGATEQLRRAQPAQSLRRAWLLRVFPLPLTKIRTTTLAERR